VHGVISRIGELFEAGQAKAVVEITEYGLGRVDKAIGTIDDSSGWFAGIVADLERLHHAACVACRPDPVALARRLFAFEVDGDWDIFIDSVERYADVLGDDGIAELRRLAGERWAELPTVGPGARSDSHAKAFHLSRMMEKLTERAGDVDARVAVMARDLSYPLDYVEIAEVLAAAGRDGDALEWAEKGIAAFDATDHPMRGDRRLDDVVLAAYADGGRNDDVVALVWRRFDERPDLGTYRRLKEWSSRVGVWDRQRPGALTRLDDDARRRAAGTGSARQVAQRRWGGPPPMPPYEDLIAVLAFDGDSDAAWSAASEHGCTQSLWLQLAQSREVEHPLDAVGVYAREAAELVDRKQSRAYEAAVERIGHIGRLYRRAGDPEGFARYLAEVRHRHKPKTKFLGLLDAAELTGRAGQ
jgi:hypothetical protein